MKEGDTTNPMVAQKRRDVNEFADILNKNPSTPLKKLAASFANKTGLKLKTVHQYYRQLVDSGAVKEREVD